MLPCPAPPRRRPAAALLLAASLALPLGGQMATPPSAPQALLRALADPDPRRREEALARLGDLGPGAPATVQALVAALGDEDLYLRGAAALALGRIGAPAVPALTQALQDPRSDVRWSAAIALGRVGSPALAALPALTKALADASEQVRQTAAVALGGLGPSARSAAPELTRLLSDRNEAVRTAAALALRQVDPAGRPSQLTPKALATTLDELVPALMAELQVPGVAIALIQNRRLVWSRGYGVRNAQTREPVTPGTVFEAASMSKPIFGLLALQLVERGRLDLDRPLEAYAQEQILPEQPERRRVTARMALSHTSGFPNWRPGGEEREGPIPLRFTPGSRFSYSGEGIFYLQRVLERVTGQPLDAWATRDLFKPLGLAATGFAWTPALGARQASGHRDDGTVLTTSKYQHPNAAYSLYTTAEDYARLLLEVMKAERGESKLLAPASIREALAHQVRLDARDPIERPGAARGTAVFWGLGWSLNATDQGDIAHHGGSNMTGFRCFSQFSPTRGTGLVILTNGTQGSDLWTRVVAAIGDL
jgi:CubicO group peptidase (beta-lactamase class C family)